MRGRNKTWWPLQRKAGQQSLTWVLRHLLLSWNWRKGEMMDQLGSGKERSLYPPVPGRGNAKAAFSTSMDLSPRDLLRLYQGHWGGSVVSLCLPNNYVVCYCFTSRPWWLHALLMNRGTTAPPQCWWKVCSCITALWNNFYCSTYIFLQDGVNANFLPLQSQILYFTLVLSSSLE